MDDEWGADRLDLEAYLLRIGQPGPVRADEQTLVRLHRAHVASIPFDNADVALGRTVSVDLDGVQEKLVARGRGGYCYEHGVLFAAVLERLGFTVDRLLARIGDEAETPRPRTHMALHVRSDDGAWLADVGFGGGVLSPIRWDEADPVSQGGWRYRLSPHRPGGRQVLEQRDGPWQVLYSLDETPQHAVDVEMAAHFTATHPSSPFAGGRLIAMHKEDRRHRRLVGRTLTTSRPDGSAEERTLDDDELAALLEEFALGLTDEETDRLVRAAPPQEPAETR